MQEVRTGIWLFRVDCYAPMNSIKNSIATGHEPSSQASRLDAFRPKPFFHASQIELRDFASLQAKCENADWRGHPLKKNLAALALLALAALSTSAQQATPKDPLLDRLAGTWVLQGTIAKHETTHDIESVWLLGHEYLQLHETSREKNAQGLPAYEAIVMIEWDESLHEYRCMWLDSTAGGGLSAEGIAHGKRGSDDIAFWFKEKDKNSGVRTTFAYDNVTDSWTWLIDNEDAGKRTRFARVKLTRK